MRANLMSLTVLCAGALLLSGCGTNWVKPGATDADRQATQRLCEADAYAKFPPRVRTVETSPGRYAPVKTTCNQTPQGQTCTQSGGEWIPPSSYRTDDNENARDADIDACFYANGWRPAKN